ncbi:helix-turn-helix domain-containing protein [Carbonactinospora thermoautotrophica]|uniref:Transcriptional regulator n=1 Tax=Carbonactinospora thermoautotrophica TaxID=1469144 RepID=A0A132MPM6_9ACTN|nr:Transcriptional regulator [Carbonactinospora thermoautotrophica]MCX9191257.1 helix-turn-helix domain-containing protein [Carbonactinospora thermoautotrophica]
MILLRRLLGDVLRRQRQRQGRTLREVSAAARVSLGYLSEIERGQKEASSELLAAICAALGVRLSDILREVSDQLALAELSRSEGMRPVLEPVGAAMSVGTTPAPAKVASADMDMTDEVVRASAATCGEDPHAALMRASGVVRTPDVVAAA